jgi:hypothetical protein
MLRNRGVVIMVCGSLIGLIFIMAGIGTMDSARRIYKVDYSEIKDLTIPELGEFNDVGRRLLAESDQQYKNEVAQQQARGFTVVMLGILTGVGSLIYGKYIIRLAESDGPGAPPL